MEQVVQQVAEQAVEHAIQVEEAASASAAEVRRPAAVGGSGGRSRLAEAVRRLGSVREARWILEHTDRCGGDWEVLVGRRLAGEPLQYVLGTWPFRGLELQVDRRVLIPRPETEQVAGVALRELARLGAHAAVSGLVLVDLGTGSGAIALSLAVEGASRSSQFNVWATDISADALAVAAANRAALPDDARARVHLSSGSWFGALPRSLAGRVGLVVSNPPYVPEGQIAALDAAVRDWEPHLALAAASGTRGVPGLADIEKIVATAPAWLAPNGVVVVELDPSQAEPAADAAARAGYRSVSVEADLSGRDRMLVARR